VKIHCIVLPNPDGDTRWWFDVNKEMELLLLQLQSVVPDARAETLDVQSTKADLTEFLNRYAMVSRPKAETRLREMGVLKEYDA
jgi:hypothetical protein